jgi:ABC-2 type transport system ATP-binding protein
LAPHHGLASADRRFAGFTSVARIRTAEVGEASIGGHRYVSLPAPADRVGAALDATSFHPVRSGRNHLRVYCKVGGYPLRRADEVLDLVGLGDAGRRAVRGYSLGMRQRLALAAALLGDPLVLVLDEPANGLDPEGIAWMRQLLREFAGQGRTVLVSSHVLSEVQQLVDHVVIINRGRLVAYGPLADLSASAAQAVSVRTPSPEDLRAAVTAADGGARVEQVEPYTVRVTGLSAARVGDPAFDAGLRLHELTPQHNGLEDVFFALTTDSDDRPVPALGEVS